MRIALLSDIHANREALTACLEHARAKVLIQAMADGVLGSGAQEQIETAVAYPAWDIVEGPAKRRGTSKVDRTECVERTPRYNSTTRTKPSLPYSMICSSRVASATPCVRAVAIRKRSAGSPCALPGRRVLSAAVTASSGAKAMKALSRA